MRKKKEPVELINGKTIEHWIALSKGIATVAHSGQFRNDGKTPYIVHPLDVAKKVNDRNKPIAILHDVFEDSKDYTFQHLTDWNFPQYIIDALKLLTHAKHEPYLDYIRRIKGNPDALAVKLADIDTNMNDNPTERQKEKYAKALKIMLA